jgi:hypothetical protein
MSTGTTVAFGWSGCPSCHTSDKPPRSRRCRPRPPRRRAASDPRRRRDTAAEPDRWRPPASPTRSAWPHRRGLVDRRPLPERGERHRALPRRADWPAGDDPGDRPPRRRAALHRGAAAPRPSRSASTASGPRRPAASSRPRRCCARRASSRTKAWARGRPDRRQPGAPGPPAGPMVDGPRPGLRRLLASVLDGSSASLRSSRTA